MATYHVIVEESQILIFSFSEMARHVSLTDPKRQILYSDWKLSVLDEISHAYRGSR